MPAGSVSWFVSLAIALLSGIVALLAGGVVADWCVSWYRISSFEGGSGYFVVFTALLAGMAGSGLGLAVARAVAARPAAGTWRATGLAVVTVLGIAGAVAGLARALADVPPEIAGERLYLLVEVRWPSGTHPPFPATGPGLVRLGAVSDGTLRRAEVGPLFLDDAREDAGSWVVPGAVEIFTTRGRRLLDVFAGETQLASILLPLRRVPAAADLEWSEWMPGTPEGQASSRIPVRYRFRVSPRTAPMRRQAVGPFTVETRVREIFRRGGADALSARSTFDIHHRGMVVPLPGATIDVAVIGTAPAVLLARGEAGCRLVRETPEGFTAVEVPRCLSDSRTWRLTPSPPATGAAHEAAPETTGWLDTRTYATPGLYLLGPALLDTRTLVMSARGWPPEPTHILEMPPVALSPDERSMAWYVPGDTETPPAIAVMRLDTGATTTLPIDRTRMRYRTPQLDMDAAWLDHHYAWVPDEDGAARLVVRETFTPLPHRGALTLGRAGEFQSYQLEPGGSPLQQAVRDLLVRELGALPRPDEYGTPLVALDGAEYRVQLDRSAATVSVFTYKGSPGSIARIGASIDRALASGRFDAMFVAEAP